GVIDGHQASFNQLVDGDRIVVVILGVFTSSFCREILGVSANPLVSLGNRIPAHQAGMMFFFGVRQMVGHHSPFGKSGCSHTCRREVTILGFMTNQKRSPACGPRGRKGSTMPWDGTVLPLSSFLPAG